MDEGVLARTERHLAETEARIVRQIAVVVRLAARGQRTVLAEELLRQMWRSLELIHEHRQIQRNRPWSMREGTQAAPDRARETRDGGPAAGGGEADPTDLDILDAEEGVVRQHALIDRLTALGHDTVEARRRLREMQHGLDVMHERRRTTRDGRGDTA